MPVPRMTDPEVVVTPALPPEQQVSPVRRPGDRRAGESRNSRPGRIDDDRRGFAARGICGGQQAFTRPDPNCAGHHEADVSGNVEYGRSPRHFTGDEASSGDGRKSPPHNATLRAVALRVSITNTFPFGSQRPRPSDANSREPSSENTSRVLSLPKPSRVSPRVRASPVLAFCTTRRCDPSMRAR